MNYDENDHNNPFKIVESMKEEFEKLNIEIRNIQHDDYFGGSWVIEFIFNHLNYKFVWDNKENWLVLMNQGRNKNHPKDWDDVFIYRYKKSTKSSTDKKLLEKHNIEKILSSLNKLN